MKTSGDGVVETSLQPRILLVDPDQHLLNSRSRLLAKLNFRLLTAGNACEVYHLRSVPMVKVAVLSDTLGDLGLRAAAECAREQWSTARILLLGAAQPSFEDYLYDEALDHRFEPDKLLDSICTLCRMSQPVGYWSHPDAPNQDQ
jgi:DNA-binding response OmpR family regulator